MLLPEAEQIVELSKTLEHQAAHLDRSKAEIAKLKRDRKATKSAGNSDYPPNLEVSLPLLLSLLPLFKKLLY